MQPYSLSGHGFVLDLPTPADTDRIREYCQDPDIQRWTTVPVPYGRPEAEQFVTHIVPEGWENDTERCWAIRLTRPDGVRVLAGTVSLRPDGQGSAEIGYLLAPDCRGRGLGTAAVRLATRHALDPYGMGLRRVVVRIFVGNRASRNLALRSGFSMDGMIRSDILHRGHPMDVWIGTMIVGDPAVDENWTDRPLMGAGR